MPTITAIGELCGAGLRGFLSLPGDACGTLETWIAGATPTHCDSYQDDLWTCALQRSGGYDGWILWDSTGAGLSVPIPSQLHLAQYHDWRNNASALPDQITVEQMPVLFDQ